MKKIFIALVATAIFSGVSFESSAQEMTKEEAREKAASVMVSFTEALKPIYQEAKPANFEEFLRVLYPNSENPGISNQARELLHDSWGYLQEKATNDQIKTSYSGVSLAKTVKLGADQGMKSTIDLNELLSGTGPFDPGVQHKSGGCGCKWHELGCWYDCAVLVINGLDILK